MGCKDCKKVSIRQIKKVIKDFQPTPQDKIPIKDGAVLTVAAVNKGILKYFKSKLLLDVESLKRR